MILQKQKRQGIQYKQSSKLQAMTLYTLQILYGVVNNKVKLVSEEAALKE